MLKKSTEYQKLNQKAEKWYLKGNITIAKRFWDKADTCKTIWVYCPKTDCDNRPFKITQETLKDAEGVIECEVCGGNCLEFHRGV